MVLSQLILILDEKTLEELSIRLPSCDKNVVTRIAQDLKKATPITPTDIPPVLNSLEKKLLAFAENPQEVFLQNKASLKTTLVLLTIVADLLINGVNLSNLLKPLQTPR